MVAALHLAGCRPAPQQDLAIATVDGEPLSAADLRETFRSGDAELRRAVRRAGGRHLLLDRTVEERLLLREARRRGLHPTFAQRQEAWREISRAFLDAELEPTVDPADVPDEAVRAEYERRAPDLVGPPTVTVLLVRSDSLEGARRIIARARALHGGDDVDGIDSIIEQEAAPSDDVPRGWDRRIVFVGADNPGVDPAVATAALSLPPESLVHGEPVPFAGAYGVVMVPARTPSRPPPPFDEMADEMRRQLSWRARDEALDRFVETFRSHHRVVVHADSLDSVDWNPPDP